MKKDIITVEGMSCQHCVKSVQDSLAKFSATAQVDLESKKVTVEYDDATTSLSDLKGAIEDQGYDVVS